MDFCGASVTCATFSPPNFLIPKMELVTLALLVTLWAAVRVTGECRGAEDCRLENTHGAGLEQTHRWKCS